MEKTEEDVKEGKAVEEKEGKETETKEEGGKPSSIPESGMGRLVMTIDRQQKQLHFCPNDLLSTATMFDGDKVRVCPLSTRAYLILRTHLSPVCYVKVRFNIATHPETKEERATYVEILPESFEESNEQRQHVRHVHPHNQ